MDRGLIFFFFNSGEISCGYCCMSPRAGLKGLVSRETVPGSAATQLSHRSAWPGHTDWSVMARYLPAPKAATGPGAPEATTSTRSALSGFCLLVAKISAGRDVTVQPRTGSSVTVPYSSRSFSRPLRRMRADSLRLRAAWGRSAALRTSAQGEIGLLGKLRNPRRPLG